MEPANVGACCGQIESLYQPSIGTMECADASGKDKAHRGEEKKQEKYVSSEQSEVATDMVDRHEN